MCKSLLLLTLILLGSGCSNTPSESLAKEAFDQSVKNEGNGCLEITKFSKTNGMEQEIAGLGKLYEIDYKATVRTKEECYLASVPTSLSAYSAKKWAGEGHYMFGRVMEPMWGSKVAVGVTRDVEGKLFFQKTEKGWQPVK